MCQRRRLQILFLMMALLGFGVACESAGDTAVTTPTQIAIAPTKTDMPTVTPTLFPTATATATSMPSPTATLMPTATATPAPTCPEPGTAVSFPKPADTTELQTAILAYLNAGGQWEELFALLDELEIKHDWIEADMNGDGVLETAVYTLLYYEEMLIPEHTWWIFQCASDKYKIIYEVGGSWVFHSHFIADDLNNDFRSEIIAVSGFAGSACDLEPKVWAWQGNEIVDFSPSENELQIGCSNNVSLQDTDHNNLKEMILVGKTVGHPDYAPPRGITQTFVLEETGYKLVDIVFAPAELRVQVLNDAQSALDAGDLPLAVSYYKQVAYEDMITVKSYYLPRPEQNDHPDEYQQSFALFRLAVIQKVLGNESEANSAFTELNVRYLEAEPGHEFVVLTQIFFNVFGTEKHLGEACEQVTKYIVEHYQTGDDPDHPWLTSHFYWGWNIAAYQTPESFCPVFSID